MKLVRDALNGILYEDDSQKMELHLVHRHNPHQPRVVISVDQL